MSTGYTATLVEEGQSFKDFVMTCARAFGPMIEMRDLPLDAPIPESFGEESSYHKEGLTEAQEELKRLQRMSNPEREAYGTAHQNDAIASYESAIEKVTAQYQRVEEMEQRVNAWNPPAAYSGLKEFMLSQLSMSKDSPNSLIRMLNETRESKPMDYWNASVECALRDISYHKQELAGSKKNAETSTKWVRNLQQLLKD